MVNIEDRNTILNQFKNVVNPPTIRQYLNCKSKPTQIIFELYAILKFKQQHNKNM